MATSTRALARLAAIAGALIGVAGLAPGATAHPHVWIDARVEVVFDAAQRMTALKVAWRFDEFYSLFAIEGLDKDEDGVVTPEELHPLAELNVTSLEPHRYFTEVFAGGQALAFGTVSDYGARYQDGILTLAFTIPLAAPADPLAAHITFRSYDPTFYLAIEPALDTPVSLTGSAPAGCRPVIEESSPPETFTLSETDLADPAVSGGIGALYATTIALNCTGAAP